MIKLNPSVKDHVIIGAFISFWLFIFAFFIKPFDDGTISLKAWIFISTGFGLIAFLCYSLLAIIQKRVYEKILKWNVYFEIASIVFFQMLFLVATYFYYKSPFLYGGYSFFEFFSIIIIKSSLVSTPIIVLARIYSVKLIPVQIQSNSPANDDIVIRGENKLDILKIRKSDLVCISNAQNYVELFFIDEHQLKSKLIRSTLKKVQSDFDFLVQVHRSHLINPSHFKSWKDQDTIILTQIELPVSKKYKAHLLTL
jgi:hypothetical protein